TAAEFADDLEALLVREPMSPTGGTLAAYLRQSFGEERYTQKTRIPTLSRMSQSGIPVPVMPDTSSSGSSPGYSVATPPPASEGQTSVVSPVSVTGIPAVGAPARRWGLVVGVAATFLLLAGGAFVVGRNVGTTPPSPVVQTPPPSANPTPPPSPVVTPDPAAPSTAPAGTVAQTAVAEAQPATQLPPPTQETLAAVPAAVASPPAEETESPAPVKEPARTAKTRVTLEAGDIQRVVARGRARIMSCFDQYKRELPSDQGEVQVRFTIFSSGRTEASIQGPLATQPVGRCLEKQVERLRFPAHRDKEVTVVQPFGYRVTR
ncbi:MAG TPA: AgmX/PglI C-terminal domain-containing protein, partial [Archangium sp.]|uniref:AgmX/PglI C-terminal domain-containing protein n=1 Tax=Archangium sp. TaxID=1872627 RepID=UPI002EDBA4B8